MGGGPKKKEEPKPEVAAPVVQKVGLKTPEKPKPRVVKRKVEPPKIVLSPLEVEFYHRIHPLLGTICFYFFVGDLG